MGDDSKKFKTRQAFDTPFDAHALTFNCYHAKPFLKAARTREYFRDAMNRAREKHEFHLWAYVLMPEHVHMLIWFPHENYSISQTLQSIKQSVSRRAIRYLRTENTDGLKSLESNDSDRPYHFWQDGGGFDKNLTFPAAIHAQIDYFHDNPVRRGFVQYPAEWEWSSAGFWLEQRPGPISIDADSLPMR